MLLDDQALLIPCLLITSRLPSEGGLWAMNFPSPKLCKFYLLYKSRDFHKDRKKEEKEEIYGREDFKEVGNSS
jgi:hypothetical protein